MFTTTGAAILPTRVGLHVCDSIDSSPLMFLVGMALPWSFDNHVPAGSAQLLFSECGHGPY
jgi:hypothetical protein